MTENETREMLTTKIPLRFHRDGHFRILMASDIHGGVGYSQETPVAMARLIAHTRPDLVLLGGDIAGPGVIHIENEKQLRDLLNTLCAPMERAGIPWAHVYGNHDDNFGLSNARQQPIYESFAHCVSKAGSEDVAGVGNYVLPIFDASGERILFNVFALDSQHGVKAFLRECGMEDSLRVSLPRPAYSASGEGPIRFSQIMWYYQASQALESWNGARIPALMYMHIPLPEFALAANNPVECALRGHAGETVSCPELNAGLFTAILQRGDVRAIFCGHDHENDFCGEYLGVTLGYDGFLSYHASHNEDIRGARVFELRADDPWRVDTRMVRLRDCE